MIISLYDDEEFALNCVECFQIHFDYDVDDMASQVDSCLVRRAIFLLLNIAYPS